MAWQDLLITSPRKRLKTLNAIRDAVTKRDLQAFEANLTKQSRFNGIMTSGGQLIELLIEVDPSLAEWLWDGGICFQHFGAWLVPPLAPKPSCVHHRFIERWKSERLWRSELWDPVLCSLQ